MNLVCANSLKQTENRCADHIGPALPPCFCLRNVGARRTRSGSRIGLGRCGCLAIFILHFSGLYGVSLKALYTVTSGSIVCIRIRLRKYYRNNGKSHGKEHGRCHGNLGHVAVIEVFSNLN